MGAKTGQRESRMNLATFPINHPLADSPGYPFVLSCFRAPMIRGPVSQRTNRLIASVGALKFNSSPTCRPVAFKYDFNWAK